MRRKSDKIPDLIVNRDGTDVAIDILNIRDRTARIDRAPESKSLYTELDVVDSSDLPYQDIVGITDDVKYKAIFLEDGSSYSQAITTRKT